MTKTVLWRAFLCMMLFGLSCSDPGPTDTVTSSSFDYPLTVGTNWLYDYQYIYTYGMGGELKRVFGLHSWSVTGTTSTTDGTTYTITNARRDSVYEAKFLPGGGPIFHDSSYVLQWTYTFSIDVSVDSIHAHWPDSLYLAHITASVLSAIPRQVPPGTDSLAVRDSVMGFAATYARGVGLVRFQGSISANHNLSEKLTLRSLSRM